MLEVKSEPIFHGGRLFYGLLSFNDAGVIANIDVLVDNVRFSKDTDPEWIAANFDLTYLIIMRYRDVIKQRYRDKLSQDFI